MSDKLTTYAAFWPYYLREHSKAATRGWHYAGSAMVLVLLAAGILSDPWWLLAIPLTGYGFAWTAHFFIEKNRPATFTYPLWSLFSDFRMFGLWLTDRLRAHLERAEVDP